MLLRALLPYHVAASPAACASALTVGSGAEAVGDVTNSSAVELVLLLLLLLARCLICCCCSTRCRSSQTTLQPCTSGGCSVYVSTALLLQRLHSWKPQGCMPHQLLPAPAPVWNSWRCVASGPSSSDASCQAVLDNCRCPPLLSARPVAVVCSRGTTHPSCSCSFGPAGTTNCMCCAIMLYHLPALCCHQTDAAGMPLTPSHAVTAGG